MYTEKQYEHRKHNPIVAKAQKEQKCQPHDGAEDEGKIRVTCKKQPKVTLM